MIFSRKWSIGIVLLASTAAIPMSLVLAALAAMALSHHSGLPWWWPFLWGLAPVALLIGVVVLVTARGDRLLAMAVGIGVVIVGYALIPVWMTLSLQKVEFVNRTSEPVLLYYARQADGELNRHGPPSLAPGEAWVSAGGFAKEGTWLRVVATRSDGVVIFDQTYTWEELSEAGNRVIIVPDSPSP